MDLELFYGKLADEAESGFKKNNLRPAYRAIKRLRGNTRSSANGSVARSDGSLCNTPAEITERWREHYQNTLNHSSVTPSKLAYIRVRRSKHDKVREVRLASTVESLMHDRSNFEGDTVVDRQPV